MTQERRSTILRYGVAVLSLIVATLVRSSLHPILGPNQPFITFLLAVLATAWFAGLGPSLLTLTAGGVVALYLFVPPEFSFRITGAAQLVGLILYVTVGLTGILIIEAQRRARARAEANARLAHERSDELGRQSEGREEAERALAVNQEYLTLALEAARIGAWQWDIKTGALTWSDSLEPLHGLAPGAFEGTFEAFLKLVHPADRDHVARAVNEAVERGTGYDAEFRVVWPDGSVHWMQGIGKVFRDEAGNPARMTGLGLDITERKRAEEALRNSERMLAQAQRMARVGSWELELGEQDNLSRGGLRWSDETFRIFGYEPGEVEVNNELFFAAVHPAEREAVRRAVDEALRAGVPYEIEHRIRRPDGAERVVHQWGEIVKDPGRRSVRMLGTCQDVTERRRAQEALRESEERLQLAQRAANVGTWEWNLKTDEVVWSEGIYALLGLEQESNWPDLKRWFEFIHPDDRAGARASVERLVAAGGVDFYHEFRVVRADGAVRWLASKGQLMRGADGAAERLIGVNLDITERKQAEESLQLHSRVLESMAEGVSVADEQGIILYTNPAEDAIFGYGRGELVGQPVTVQNTYPPEENERVVAEVVEQLRTRGVWQGEFSNRKKDGTAFTTYARISALDLGDKKYWVCVQEDITERKARERERAELLARERAARAAAEDAASRIARLQTITAGLTETLTREQVVEVICEQVMKALGANGCALVAPSPDGRELQVLRATGYPPELVERWRRFPVEADAPLTEAIRTGKPFIAETGAERDARYPRMRESLRELGPGALIAVPLVAQGRAVGGLGLTFAGDKRFDAAERAFLLALAGQCAQALERARLYEAERNARAQAEVANRAKDEFLATVSHELRTPLTAILGWSKMMRGGQLNEELAARAVEVIERNANAQAQLIEDLLDITRIIAGRLRLDVQDVELVPVIEAAVESVRLAAEAKGVRLQTVLDPRAGPVSGDAARLQQVIWNLLSNAIKFTPRGGRVQVRLARAGSHVELTVSDTGIGISPDFLPYVFERFRQADPTTTRVYGGLGLGLAIARHLVELHGGAIEAASPGGGLGATFTVRLPLVAALGEPRAERRSRASGGAGPLAPPVTLEGLRVLVVEDEADGREMIRAVLSQSGASVATAGSVAQALEELRRARPDVLVSDIGMPGEDGYELIRRARSLEDEINAPRVPAVAVTAYARAEDRVRVRAAGYQVHLAKPVEPAELVAVVASLAGRTNWPDGNGHGAAD